MSLCARAWLEARADVVPPELHAEMMSAVDEANGEAATIHAALAEAARISLRKALSAGDQRAAALPLLAADALVTYACQSAAAADRDALEELARSCGPEGLAVLLPPRMPS